jgi:Glycosyl transferase family 2
VIPVVVFAFRRPDLLEQTLDSLRHEPVPLLIAFSDGPRDRCDEAPVAAVRKLLRTVNWCPAQVVERHANLGLGHSVVDGVTRVLARYEAVIVIEDDLVVVPGTYEYLAASLRHYEQDQRVISVTGWTHPRITPAGLGEQPYFDGKGECWVWGTWPRSWRGMHRPALDIMRDCAGRGIDIRRYGSDMPKMAAEAAPRNLWAVGWWYHHMLHNGLCLRPPRTLSEHTGWDDRATTTVPAAAVWRNPPLIRRPDIPAPWPDPAEHPDCPRLWRTAIGDPW